MNNKTGTAASSRALSVAWVGGGKTPYVLHSFCKFILAYQALTFFYFGRVQPRDTLVKEVTQCFRFDGLADGRGDASSSKAHRRFVS